MDDYEPTMPKLQSSTLYHICTLGQYWQAYCTLAGYTYNAVSCFWMTQMSNLCYFHPFLLSKTQIHKIGLFESNIKFIFALDAQYFVETILF